MKRSSLLIVIALLAFCASLGAQSYVIDDFDNSVQDSLYDVNVEGAPSTIRLMDDHVDYVEGTGAMKVDYVIGSFHEWGSFANLIYRTDSTETMDWSVSDSLSIWLKVHNPPTHPEYMVFRLHIADRPNPTDDIEEYIYENGVILDNQTDWVELKIPFYEIPTNGTVVPGDSGFVLFPTSWGGGTYNNSVLDRDKIVGYNLSAVVSGYDPAAFLPADSVFISFDNFTRYGTRAVPFIIFNGMVFPSYLSAFTWGQSSMMVETGAGATPGTNAIKWVQGDEWGSGWSGFGLNISPAQNMLGSWRSGDSIHFKLKAQPGTGDLRVQLESGADGKVGKVFTPIDDDQWHDYVLALRDFTYQDGTSNFDSSSVVAVQMMAEASAVAGNVVYMDDWWTGNPVFDVIPPNPPSPVAVTAGTYSNLITWLDPEPGASYTIYYSKNPITDVNAPGVEYAGTVDETPPSVFEHSLVSPVSDSTVTYYYAVTAMDAAGNVSDPAVTSGPVTNTAKGIVTVSMNPPSNFNADGVLTEWSGIAPIRIFPSEGAHIVTNTTINGDNDLSVLAYVAMDNDYLYVAFDVTDDVIDTTAADSWEKDSPDMYLGLYDWRGLPHNSLERGEEPDYHFRFNSGQLIIDNIGSYVLMSSSAPNYAWVPKFPAGYIVEAKIALADLAAAGNDDLFTPVEGYRLPIDFSINDADGGGVRQGILTHSPYNDDTSYQSPEYWVFTWLGQRATPVGIGDNPLQQIYTYNLEQNYPNPFNPMTTISYTLEKAGAVQLDVFNTLGQKVKTIVNGRQAAGVYHVQFSGLDLPSGIYFYRLTAGNYQQNKKMILMK
ncbi:MAG: sugar-binding protein [Calditrichia bacterium]